MTETGYARILLDKKDTQIMKLESEITKLRIEYESQVMKLLKKNKELEKENAELKKEVEYAETHCLYHSDCPNKKENTELKADNDARKFAMAMSENVEKQLRDENAELKADNVEWEKASDKWKSVYEITNNQLTNAKEIIREFMKYEINEYDGSLEIHFEELKKQAEQFLKGVKNYGRYGRYL